MTKEISKIYIGPRDKYIPGYFNIDADKNCKADFYCDALELPKYFKSNSLEEIAWIHGIEHLTFKKSKIFLKNCHNLLKTSGVLRLSVPDLRTAFAHYFYWGDMEAMHSMLYGSQVNDSSYDIHYSGYCEETLTKYLLEAGFSKVEKWDWKTTEPFNYVDSYAAAYWPHFQSRGFKKNEDTPIGKLLSLNLVGIK